jgi:hypothetical protein
LLPKGHKSDSKVSVIFYPDRDQVPGASYQSTLGNLHADHEEVHLAASPARYILNSCPGIFFRFAPTAISNRGILGIPHREKPSQTSFTAAHRPTLIQV